MAHADSGKGRATYASSCTVTSSKSRNLSLTHASLIAQAPNPKRKKIEEADNHTIITMSSSTEPSVVLAPPDHPFIELASP